MILFMRQDDIIGVALFIDACLERVYTSAGPPVGDQASDQPRVGYERCEDSSSSAFIICSVCAYACLWVFPIFTWWICNAQVVAVTAVRTGAGKSQVSQYVSTVLREHKLKTVLIRHPMPYGEPGSHSFMPSNPQIRCVAADILWQPSSLPCLGKFLHHVNERPANQTSQGLLLVMAFLTSIPVKSWKEPHTFLLASAQTCAEGSQILFGYRSALAPCSAGYTLISSS